MPSTGILFEMAGRNVKLHLVRSLLAAVGIVIGVLAITAMGMMGAALQQTVTSELSGGADSLMVYPKISGSDGGGITERQLRDIRMAAGPNQVVPIMSGSDRVVIGSETGSAMVYGFDPGDLDAVAEVEKGVAFRGSAGVLVGPTLARDYDLRVGSRLFLGKEGEERAVRVVGVLKESGFSGTMMTDNAVLVPERWYTGAYGDEGYDMVQVVVRSLDEIDQVKERIEDRMNRREDTVMVWDSRAFLDMIDEALGSISLFVMAIGGISLVVAAVSIFNVMLMSVNERVKEIGILRSLGAQKHEITQLFLYESVILGLIGAGTGAIFSLGGGYILMLLMFQDTTYFFTAQTLLYVPFGMGVGVVVCLLSGVYPALRAASLNPVEALAAE
ncbi:putative ABC transport system permease protein [Methanofollis sp. W23]|uniref:ABC transporter permease n=1 Tax=Methanofollis sp. W23 TaxID=2817849 RepID=UPI001AE60AFF|nr:ABC transporter permease [Methanofollis sp. W23]MBP2146380.1 putative ABC transport system permease protein [Methanofollis sp. W23]